MSFEGAEIPAWGMFVLAIVFLLFQFLLKWQEAQAKRIAKRDGKKTIEEQLEAHEKMLAEMTLALAGITKLLAVIARESRELHVAHLGARAIDDDNRPKWWADRESMKKIQAHVESMDRHMESLVNSLRRRGVSVTDLPRPAAEKK